MTSMPASLSARAMIFAPAVVTVEPRLRDDDPDLRWPWCASIWTCASPSSAHHRPGRTPAAPSRATSWRATDPLLLDCGPGVLGRLRELELYPRSIAITHFHLDHWGDLVPWAWLNAYGPQEHRIACTLWLPPGGRAQLEAFAAHWGTTGMFDEAFELQRVRAGRAVPGRRLRGRGLQPAALRPISYGFRVTQTGRRSRTRATPRRRTSSRRSRAEPTSSSARRRSAARTTTGTRAGTCPPTRRSPQPTARSSSRTGRSSSLPPTACRSRTTASSSTSRGWWPRRRPTRRSRRSSGPGC